MKKHSLKTLVALLLILLLVDFVIKRMEGKKEVFIFAPNSVIVKKIAPLEILETKERVAAVVANKDIVDGSYAKLGSALRLAGDTIFLIKNADLLEEYILHKPSSSLPSSEHKGFLFSPNSLGQRIPIPVEILELPSQVEKALQDSNIYNHEKATLGAAISQSFDGKYLNLIPLEGLEKSYAVVLPLREYLKQTFLSQKQKKS